jgi:hypothetical protein
VGGRKEDLGPQDEATYIPFLLSPSALTLSISLNFHAVAIPVRGESDQMTIGRAPRSCRIVFSWHLPHQWPQ